jgi:hypothetical protein
MIRRPDYTTILRESEGEESTWFRSKFKGWDDVIPVNHTMTAEAVQRRGADIKVIMKRDQMKVDTEALFTNRMVAFSHSESDILMEECNADLEVIESFVLVIIFATFIQSFIFSGTQEVCQTAGKRIWNVLYKRLL